MSLKNVLKEKMEDQPEAPAVDQIYFGPVLDLAPREPQGSGESRNGLQGETGKGRRIGRQAKAKKKGRPEK